MVLDHSLGNFQPVFHAQPFLFWFSVSALGEFFHAQYEATVPHVRVLGASVLPSKIVPTTPIFQIIALATMDRPEQ